MKKVLSILINVMAIVPFIVFYRFGGNVAIYMIPVILILSLINVFLSETKKDFLIKNLFLGISNVLGILIDCLLYFIFICHDSVGEAVLALEIFIAIIYVALLSVIGYIIKGLILKFK